MESMDIIDLFLTNDCNQNCEFCFLKGKQRKKHLSIDSFNKFLTYLKKLNIKHLALLGGEPTIYPNLAYVTNRLNEEKISYTIFSNGMFNKEYLCDVKLENVQVSVHMPHTSQKREKIIENLEYLKYRKAKVLLRDVITPDYNFAESLRFVKQYRSLIDGVRFKIALPNLERSNKYVLDFKSIKNKLLKFLKGLDLLGVSISNCCFLPYCEFSHKELVFLNKINYLSACRRVFYIDTDLTIRMCPYHNHIFSEKIFDLGKIMKRRSLIKFRLYERCRSCNFYLQGKCVPCLAYNPDSMKDFKKFQEILLE